MTQKGGVFKLSYEYWEKNNCSNIDLQLYQQVKTVVWC